MITAEVVALLKPSFTIVRADSRNFCSVIIKGKVVNLGDANRLEAPRKLRFSGHGKFLRVLRRELNKLEQL